MTTTIARVRAITQERFLEDHVAANRPLVVEDALADWRIAERWTPSFLRHSHGKRIVPIYNSYFDLVNVSTLAQYLDGDFARSPERGAGPGAPYVRWYTKFRETKLMWADAFFEGSREHWTAPSFLPTDDYAFPFSPTPRRVDPRDDYFPAKGLFISGKGARTALHVDPWGSDAILCHVYGNKTWTMYAPDQAELLRCGDDVVDPDAPDGSRFPRFERAEAYRFSIGPGDVVYVPHGWFHHVVSDTPAISLTWNFVHSTTVPAFLRWLERAPSEIDRSILRFFFGLTVAGDASPEALTALVRSRFAGTRSAGS